MIWVHRNITIAGPEKGVRIGCSPEMSDRCAAGFMRPTGHIGYKSGSMTRKSTTRSFLSLDLKEVDRGCDEYAAFPGGNCGHADGIYRAGTINSDIDLSGFAAL